MKIRPHLGQSTCLASIAILLASLQSSYGELITIPPGNVTASSEIPPNFNRQDDFIVDGSGLFDGQHIAAVEGNMWLSRGTDFGGDDTDPFVIFDLGEPYTITSIRVWNYNESPPDLTSRGVNAVSIEYGATAELGSTLAGITNFAKADGTDTYEGEVFDSFVPFTAQFIKIDIDSNHGGDNNFYGLSEVQFDGILGGIALTPNIFSTTAAQGDPVGILSTPAGNVDDTFTYAFVVGAGSGDNDKFQIVDNELQLGAHDFSTATDGQEYSVRLLSTGAPSGTTTESDLILTAQAPDLTEPMISSLSPAKDSMNVAIGDDLVLTFDEEVMTGTGNITVKNLTDVSETVIPIDDAQISVDRAILTIDLVEDLIADKNYAVQIDASAIEDLSGNSFAGIADDNTWNFSVPSGPPITLVGYWPFERDVDPQPDLSEFLNDAKVFPGATWVNDDERGGVMEFNGNDSFLEAADSESLSLTGDVTIAAWINVTSYDTFRGIVGKSAGPNGNLPASYDLYLVQNDGRARLYTGSPDGFAQVTGTTSPALEEWHHLAVTRIGDEVTFYYDGQLDGQGTTNQPMLDSDATLRIGNRTDLVTPFFGRMDDVAIFDGGLSAAQIMDVMDGDFSEFGAGSGGNTFRITDISYIYGETPSVEFTFTSRPDRTYKIEASTNLLAPEVQGGWFEVDDSFASQGEETTYVDTIIVGGPRVFYRVTEN